MSVAAGGTPETITASLLRNCTLSSSSVESVPSATNGGKASPSTWTPMATIFASSNCVSVSVLLPRAGSGSARRVNSRSSSSCAAAAGPLGWASSHLPRLAIVQLEGSSEFFLTGPQPTCVLFLLKAARSQRALVYSESGGNCSICRMCLPWGWSSLGLRARAHGSR